MGSSIAGHFVGWQGGILMSVIAFSIVFLVIAGLMFMMMLLKVIVKAINPDKSPASPGSGTAAPQPHTPAAVQTVRYEPPAEDDGELIAVFAAAIAAAGGQPAAVLSYAPTAAASGRPATSAWRMAGILSNSRGLRN